MRPDPFANTSRRCFSRDIWKSATSQSVCVAHVEKWRQLRPRSAEPLPNLTRVTCRCDTRVFARYMRPCKATNRVDKIVRRYYYGSPKDNTVWGKNYCCSSDAERTERRRKFIFGAAAVAIAKTQPPAFDARKRVEQFTMRDGTKKLHVKILRLPNRASS